MTKKVVTNDGKKGGWLVGKRHYDKNGKSLGGIKAVVTDAGGKPVELEGGEVIINREASKKYWKELSRINQSAGNGVAIEPPTDAFDEDPAEDYENGGKIEFNANHIPNKWILNYAIKIKEEHPDVWALGGNIFGNQAFINLKRVAERGHWLDSEEWMYKKWRSFVARHKGDFRIQGVIAMLKWVDKVDKGWQYMKNLIEEEIKKREARKSKKMSHGGKMETGGWVQKPIKIKPDVYKFEDHQGVGYIVKRGVGDRITPMWVVSTDEEGTWDGMNELFYTKKAAINYIESFFEKGGKMSNGGNLSKTPAPLSERIKGSKTNPKGTAKDAKSGASIKFDDNTLASIQSLIDAHNEKYPSKKITLGVAKAVVRRGMGAYSGTHRPTITGGKPNSRTAWGLARLKAFIHKAEKGKSKSGKYSQDNDLFDDLDITVSKFDNGGSTQSDRYYKHGYTLEQVNAIDKYLDKLNLIKVKGPKPEFESPSIYWVKKMSDEYPVVQFYRDMVYMDDKIMHEILRSTKPPFGSKETSGQRGYNPEQLAFGKALLEWVVRQLNLSENYLDRRLTGTYVFASFEPGKPYAKYNTLPDDITKFEAGGLISPTGKPSNLTPEQYKLVRTPEFKRWFGDWENDSKNASKVVDFKDYNNLSKPYTNEPLVVYHASFDDFNEFDKNRIGQREEGWFGKGIYFGTNELQVKRYGPIVKPYFLQIKKPFQFEGHQKDFAEKFDLDYNQPNFGNSVNEILTKQGFDGLIIDSVWGKEYIVFEPNQIKIADGTNTTFDANNPDIRFEDGGGIDKIKTSKDENGNWKGKYLDYKFTLYHLPEGWSFTLYYYSTLMLSDDMYFSDQDFPPFITKKAAIKSLIEVANDLKNKYKHGGSIELEKGIKAEYEHAKTIAKFKREGISVRDVARSIAEDHLKEDPHYYSKLEKMEGKKFATGGLVTDAGGTANVGDKGVLETRNGPIQILITGITDKKVRFKIVSDNNRPDSNPVESFVRNYRGAFTSLTTPTPKAATAQTSGEWRVKTYDELKEQGLLSDNRDTYRGINNDIINNWAGRNVKEISKDVLIYLDSGSNSSFAFDGFSVKSNLFTKDPLPSTQSNIADELNNYRIKTEQEFINEYGKNWQKEVGWVNRSDAMDWLFGEKITDIVTSDRYGEVLENIKNGDRFTSNFSIKPVSDATWSISPAMYMFDPALNSQNVATNLVQTQQKDLRPSTDSNVWDASFKVGDVVYIRKDIADFVGIDFDSKYNVFEIVKEISEPTAKRPENKTGRLYKIVQVKIKNNTNERIFQLEGKDIALVDSNQAKPQGFGEYILKNPLTEGDLIDTKIIVDTEEKSKAFQKLVLDLGIPWFNGKTTIEYVDKPYLFVEKSSGTLIYLTFASRNKDGQDYYEKSTNKELNFNDIFELKGQTKPVLSDESLEELFKGVQEIDKEREAVEATPQKNETQINDELKALEDEYNDLLFLIDITPSTDVDNMLALKLQAKQLKDKIDLLHLDLKKKIDGELELLDNLFNASSVQPQERYKFNPYNDGFAPDGQPTSLPKNLYDWTMTQEFQNWFGNFTNAYNYRNSSYENTPCSVVVNKHYEPLVVYHGTGVEFSFFKFDKFPAMYFAENEAYSNWFAEIKGQQVGTNGYVYPFFLNIRTPLDLTIYGINPVSPDEFIDWMFLQTGLDADELKISKALLDPSQKFQAWMYLRNSPEMLNVLRDKAICDGIIYYEDNPSVDKSSDAYQTKAYIVFNSNSAKIADPNREMMTIPAMRSFYLKRGGKL